MLVSPLYLCMQVEWAHVIISKDEKMYMVAGALLGAVVCYALLVWVPPQALAFHAAAASEEATSRMALLVRSRFKNLPAAELQPIKDAGPLGAALAVVGGALSKEEGEGGRGCSKGVTVMWGSGRREAGGREG